MERIFELATSISTPLGLGGLIAAILFFVLKSIVRSVASGVDGGSRVSILVLIINRLFQLSLVSMFLGFFSYILSYGSGERRYKNSIPSTQITLDSLAGICWTTGLYSVDNISVYCFRDNGEYEFFGKTIGKEDDVCKGAFSAIIEGDKFTIKESNVQCSDGTEWTGSRVVCENQIVGQCYKCTIFDMGGQFATTLCRTVEGGRLEKTKSDMPSGTVELYEGALKATLDSANRSSSIAQEYYDKAIAASREASEAARCGEDAAYTVKKMLKDKDILQIPVPKERAGMNATFFRKKSSRASIESLLPYAILEFVDATYKGEVAIDTIRPQGCGVFEMRLSPEIVSHEIAGRVSSSSGDSNSGIRLGINSMQKVGQDKSQFLIVDVNLSDGYYLGGVVTSSMKYYGQFKDGNINGYGVAFYTDGSKYSGEWKDDKIYGVGVYTFSADDKNVSISGSFKNGDVQDFAALERRDGSIAFGKWDKSVLKDNSNIIAITLRPTKKSGHFISQ